ncbi:HTH domain-containing protein [Paenibacillus sp. P26]|nr:HTH domain-containing protein [Paenibacillus sp. P26]
MTAVNSPDDGHQRKKKFTVRELADEFGLSPRTITRDLQELSEIGVPIYTVQGRGGGYRSLQERMFRLRFLSRRTRPSPFSSPARPCSISALCLLMRVRRPRFISSTITFRKT